MLRDLFSLFPAHAGVILASWTVCRVSMSFPRTCGGDPPNVCCHSPHMVLFPAHAGVILGETGAMSVTPTFPRTCGGDPQAERGSIETRRFSPHMRG